MDVGTAVIWNILQRFGINIPTLQSLRTLGSGRCTTCDDDIKYAVNTAKAGMADTG